MPKRPYWIQQVGPETRGNRFKDVELLDSVDAYIFDYGGKPSTPAYTDFYVNLPSDERGEYVSPRQLVTRFGKLARKNETAWQCAVRRLGEVSPGFHAELVKLGWIAPKRKRKP